MESQWVHLWHKNLERVDSLTLLETHQYSYDLVGEYSDSFLFMCEDAQMVSTKRISSL